VATYIVGDVQGCCDELQQLLELADFNPAHDELWLTGDLVSRGPKSLETLRFIKGLGKAAKVVLGNHDLHLLAVHQHVQRNNKKDQLQHLLNSPDCDDLLNWLRFQPLILRHPEFDFVMVHAGISPQWSVKQAEKLAKEVELQLNSDGFEQLLAQMYGDHPHAWSESLQGIERLRFIINAFTRMRYCTADGALDFVNKLAPAQTNDSSIIPWFNIPSLDKSTDIIFGHWAALLGKVDQSGVYGLDTGCVWGNSLTMLRWQDKKTFSLSCPLYCK